MVLPFEEEYRKKYYKLLDEVFDSNFWSDGKMTRMFEEKFEEYTGLPSCAVTSGGAGLLSIFEYIGVRGYDVAEKWQNTLLRESENWGIVTPQAFASVHSLTNPNAVK